MANDNITLRVHVSLSSDQYGGQGLQFSEDVTLPKLSFLEVAKVLGMFHDLAETIQKNRGHPDGR